MRKALIETATGKVVNVIELEYGANWQPPQGCYVRDAQNASPGDTWDGSKFIPAPTVVPEPPHSTHVSILVGVDAAKARPAKIKRVWNSRDYYYDCFATQTVKDEFVAGKISVGDYVLVHFDDILGEQVVTAKVFKSW